MILVNSNPATIMTDPEFADVTYIEPLTVEILEKIIAKERPSALLPTLGGQTALNLSMELHKLGILAKYGVEMIGAKPRRDLQGRGPRALQAGHDQDRPGRGPFADRADPGGGAGRGDLLVPYVLRPGPAVQQRPDARRIRIAEVLARGDQPQIAIIDKDRASKASGQPVRKGLNLLDAHCSLSATSIRSPDQTRYVLLIRRSTGCPASGSRTYLYVSAMCSSGRQAFTDSHWRSRPPNRFA